MTAPETFSQLNETLDKGRRPDMTDYVDYEITGDYGDYGYYGELRWMTVTAYSIPK